MADSVAICGPEPVGAVTCHDAVSDDSAAMAEAVVAAAAATFQPDGAPLRMILTLLNDPGPLLLNVAATVAEPPGGRIRPEVGLNVNDACWSAPGRAGNGSRADAVCAARLAAVVAASNWVFEGAGCAFARAQGPGEVAEGLPAPAADVGEGDRALAGQAAGGRDRLDEPQAGGVVGDLGEDPAAHRPGRDDEGTGPGSRRRWAGRRRGCPPARPG